VQFNLAKFINIFFSPNAIFTWLFFCVLYSRIRNEQYHFLQKALGLRHVYIQTFGKMNFVYTVLSKRRLAWFVDTGRVESWFDPRFPTIQVTQTRISKLKFDNW
jgi:hypothetical protein